VLGLMLTLAEWERDRIREQWGKAQAGAQARGIHVGPCPFGYMRTGSPSKPNGKPTGPLVVDPEAAPLVLEAFERRARGEGLRTIAKYLHARGHGMTTRGVARMVTSRVYLGEASAPLVGKLPGAHEAIVDPELFDRCQWTDGPIERRHGSLVESVALVSVRCAGCGKVMSVGRSSKGDSIWRCGYVGCTDRGSVAAHRLDAHVQDVLDTAIAEGATVTDLLLDDAHLASITDEVTAARSARDELFSSVVYGKLSPADAAALLKAASERVAIAEAARNAVRPSEAPLTSRYVPAVENPTLEQRRAQFGRLVSEVRVGKAASRVQPLGEHVAISLAA
jgi:hypothetical protein